jgi:flagella basal body P-ring formation protein FlgA
MRRIKAFQLRACLFAAISSGVFAGASALSIKDAFAAGQDTGTRDPVITLVAENARQLLLDKVKQLGFGTAEVNVDVLPDSRGMAPCHGPLSVEPVDTRFPTRMRFAAICRDPNARKEYVARARVFAEVVVTSSALPAEQMFGMQDVVLERRDITAGVDAIPDAQAVIGMASKRSVRAGQVVQKQWLIAPVLVRRGETVTILAINGPVEVSVVGEALEAGRRDDVIKVRNVSTGKVIRARVSDKGVVGPADQLSNMSPQSPD